MKQLLVGSVLLLLLLSSGECVRRPLESLWIQDDFPGFRDLKFKRGEPWNPGSDFTHVQLANLEAIYSDSFSLLKKLDYLRIFYTQLKVIEPGAFAAIPKLKQLDLDLSWNPYPIILSKETFKNLDILEELNIRSDENNSKISITEDAFQNLPKLKRLQISNVNIGTLKKDFVKDSHLLEALILFECNIDIIESNAFDPNTNLEELQIIRNKKLTHLQKDLFKNLSKLSHLLIQENGFKNLEWDEFTGLGSLKWLNIAQNQVTSFDVDKIARSFPNLEEFVISNNPLSCQQLESFANELKKKYTHALVVTYAPFPYQQSTCSKQ